MCTVGYGDITPKNTNEYLFNIFTMLVAGWVFSYSLKF